MFSRTSFIQTTLFVVSIVILIGSIQHAYSADLTAGKTAAQQCIACHGPQGISLNPVWPNLAGQKKDYLIKQLKAFQEDTRQDPLMTTISKNLNSTDLENITAYFSSLKIEIKE